MEAAPAPDELGAPGRPAGARRSVPDTGGGSPGSAERGRDGPTPGPPRPWSGSWPPASAPGRGEQLLEIFASAPRVRTLPMSRSFFSARATLTRWAPSRNPISSWMSGKAMLQPPGTRVPTCRAALTSTLYKRSSRLGLGQGAQFAGQVVDAPGQIPDHGQSHLGVRDHEALEGGAVDPADQGRPEAGGAHRVLRLLIRSPALRMSRIGSRPSGAIFHTLIEPTLIRYMLCAGSPWRNSTSPASFLRRTRALATASHASGGAPSNNQS